MMIIGESLNLILKLLKMSKIRLEDLKYFQLMIKVKIVAE